VKRIFRPDEAVVTRGAALEQRRIRVTQEDQARVAASGSSSQAVDQDFIDDARLWFQTDGHQSVPRRDAPAQDQSGNPDPVGEARDPSDLKGASCFVPAVFPVHAHGTAGRLWGGGSRWTAKEREDEQSGSEAENTMPESRRLIS